MRSQKQPGIDPSIPKSLTRRKAGLFLLLSPALRRGFFCLLALGILLEQAVEPLDIVGLKFKARFADFTDFVAVAR